LDEDEQVNADHIESDVVDLTGVSIAALRGIPLSERNQRLLDQVWRARSNAIGGGSNPGRAE
jgi:hypothetical protein